ncbi:MAG TPA: nucleotide disphospho-sugar-binding domain-containing protein [Solirubrobacterales bacterium]|jgi:UDP:flavonoid glycosyltransferase YjiC (YdhE family)|nr:nucleotide disphospho-sugar-binding domain-containing protein [Solirubrobacterales bacterium]
MRVLAYTSPARGHLGPMMAPLLELKRRGAEVHVRTLAAAVEAVRTAGLECEPIDPRIEALSMDDHRAKSRLEAGRRAFGVWARRARFDAPDFEAALAASGAELALVDTTAFGAKAVAEREGLPWAESRPFLLEDRAPGLPPFGFGLRPRGGPLGRARDAVVGLASRRFDALARLPTVNAGREAAALPALGSIAEARQRAPLTLYFTAEPFEYRRPLPPGVLMVGAGLWDQPGELPPSLPEDPRPLVLVACSSEFQDDGAIAAGALEGLSGSWRVVVTSAAVDPASLPRSGDAVVERFLPHGPLLERAAAVVCHGGMGITQKALAYGVPVCVVPWTRDQLDVAAHVVEAGAGTRLPRRRLTPQRLAAAVAAARECEPGAARVRAGYEATGTTATAATALERLLL